MPIFDRSLRYTTIATGWLPALVGLSVILGWHTHNARLTQIVPQSAAMVYNTALCFGAASGAFWACWLKKRAISVSLALSAAGVAALTLIQDLSGANLGIDQLLVTAYNHVATNHPGRMAPNSAVAFLLFSASVILLNSKTKYRALLAGSLGCVLLALGVVPLIGFLGGVPAAYAWGKGVTQMAVHTAGCFVCLGISILGLVWREKTNDGWEGPRLFPTLAGIASAAVTILLWRALVTQS